MKYFYILAFSCGYYLVMGQFYHSPVLSDLQGDALLEQLVDAYKTSTTLDDSSVKDTLMAVIFYDSDHQEVQCVYTHHTKSLSPDSDDPNQEVFDNGQSTGLNVEHIYPRNKGAKIGIAETDMHHLAPAKVNVNGDRNNLPFAELPDNQTDRWYYLGMERTTRPTSDIDEWSEWTNMGFEPREDFKGNVARAVMYFYTMYQSAADGEDPQFFDLQKETLCNWHFDDPVDAAEWHRTWLIADYQDDKPNPFVLDCSVAARTYCGESTAACDLTVGIDPVTNTQALHLYPNPVQALLTIDHPATASLLTIYDQSGRAVMSRKTTTSSTSTAFDTSSLPSGLYIISSDSGWKSTFIRR